MASQAKIRATRQGAFVVLTPEQLTHLNAKVGDDVAPELREGSLLLRRRMDASPR